MPKTPSPERPAACPDNLNEPVVSSSPAKANVSGRMTFADTESTRERRRLDLCLEVAGNFAGECEASKFLNYLPKVKGRRTPSIDFSGVPYGKGEETNMYEPFAEAINNSSCCPSLVVHDTSTKGDATSKLKPDCGLFLDKISESDAKARCMSLVDIFVEFKPEASDDAFHAKMNNGAHVEVERAEADHKLEKDIKEFQKMTSMSIKNRGQQIEYASVVMALQHRTHVFSISINGPKARLIRWDRAGACVSEAFDYILTDEHRKKKKTNWLAEFLFRYAHATPEQRGFDPNVRPATKDQLKQLADAVQEHINAFPYPQHLADELKRAADSSYDSYPAYIISVTDGTSGEKTDYIVCRPFFEVLSLCSRATRGYLAYSTKREELVFLKDTWRVDDPNDSTAVSEAQIYEILRKYESLEPYLPVIFAAGDVYGADPGAALHTKTQDMKDCQWVPGPEWFRRYVRHRVVQKLAIPLHMLRNSKQLLQAIRNILTVIKIAYHEGKILHRDISMNNIMLNLSFGGILNDWDHAIRTDIPTRKVHTYRTGTWQFMSIEVLKNTRKPHSIHDDVESTFWVFYHTALHYFKIKKNNAPFKQPSLALFNECEITTGEEGQLVYVGGSKKVDTLTSGTIQKVFFESEPLTTALHKFATILSRHRTHGSTLQFDPSDSSKAVFDEVDQKIYGVEEIIKIFDSTIANADETSKWPEHDDAVEDQYKVKSTLDEHIQLAGAHEAHVTRSQDTSRKPAPQPQADGDMVPPAFIPSRRVTRSVTRKNAKNAPPPVASGSGVPPSMSRSTSKRHRVSDEDAKVEVEGSEGRTKRSRQQKTKPIVRTASSEQKNYNTRSHTRSLKQGVVS